MEGEAWVTLATNDEYSLGALVLAHSLKRCHTQRKIVVMVTSSISDETRNQLTESFDAVIDVNALDSNDAANLALLERPELGITFTKINCWKLTQFSKCIFLDADTLVVQNCDELFEREEFSASPDPGWPDCFNSGVFVFVPSVETYENIMKHAATEGSFDGGDQGLLNSYFSDWAYTDIHKHLPFLYNMVATATYSYTPAYRRFGSKVKIVHFIGAAKPWKVSFDQKGDPIPNLPEDFHSINHLKNWWAIYKTEVKPRKEQKSLVMEKTEDKQMHWELGRPDYMGAASSDNILKKIDSSISMPVVGEPSVELTEEEKAAKGHWEQGAPDYMGVSSMDNIIQKLDNIVRSTSRETSPDK